MNLPAALFTVRCLVKDTFRQAWASGVFWLMLVLSGLVILLCLSARIEVNEPFAAPRPYEKIERVTPTSPEAKRMPQESGKVDVFEGEWSLGFGAVREKWERPREAFVRSLEFAVGGFGAETLGVWLALVWTAGFLPSFLEPSAAAVLLAKPVPRWSLLSGKILGVLAFLTVQATFFVGGMWLALGVATAVWSPIYLINIPLLVLHVAVFYSFSALLAVLTRSTAACVFGSLLFWGMCWGMNLGRHALVGYELENVSAFARFMTEAGYWFLPKPGDLFVILYDALEAEAFIPKPESFALAQKNGAFHPIASVLASLAFAVVTLIAAGWQFEQTDY